MAASCDTVLTLGRNHGRAHVFQALALTLLAYLLAFAVMLISSSCLV
jgi:hypothetical protein